jgi:endonuclease/exonuclease/phosphatase family metal-dependent hydrolase
MVSLRQTIERERIVRIIGLLILAVFLGTSTGFAGPQKEVTVMTFNVENLFDNTHDYIVDGKKVSHAEFEESSSSRKSEKNDFTYLPVSKKRSQRHKDICAKVPRKSWRDQCLYWDWNDWVLHTKMVRISETILQMNGGKGPDILFLQEVENADVIETLRKKYLKDSGYGKVELIEGRDKRGIDVAILTRLKVLQGSGSSSRLFDTWFDRPEGMTHEKFIHALGDVRGIMRTIVELPDGSPLTLLAVHFPAQHIPQSFRYQQADHLRLVLNRNTDKGFVIASGDFNISGSEDEEVGMYDYLAGKEDGSPDWLVSHQTGCSGCNGTYFSSWQGNDEWSFLDAFLYTPSLQKTAGKAWYVETDSIRVANSYKRQNILHGDMKVPNRFRLSAKYGGHPKQETITGVSDHWPLVMKLRLRSSD